ncbi:MAG: AsmA family protein, partial [Candidatus Acidiferrales bacterium]
MSLGRKILLSVVVVVVVLVVAAGIFVATFDANQYRGLVLEQLSRSLNRPVEASELKLQIFPLRLRLDQVRVKENPAFAEDDFLRAAAVQFDVSLGALLSGDVQVTAIELIEPTIHLHQDAEGRWNVTTLGAAPSEDAQPSTPAPAAAPGPPPIEDWRIEKGTILIERPNERPLQLTGVELALSNLSTTRPFPFALAVSFAPESRIAAEGIVGPLNFEAIERSPLEAEVTLEKFQPASLRTLMAVPPRLAALG